MCTIPARSLALQYPCLPLPLPYIRHPPPPLPLLYPSLLTSPKSELDETPCFLLREKSGKTHKLAVEDFEQQCLQT